MPINKREMKEILAGYLPHKLMFKGDGSHIFLMVGWNTHPLIVGSPDGFLQYFSIDMKPILHPLSDLTKPITVKGETFVPIQRLVQLAGYDFERFETAWTDVYGFSGHSVQPVIEIDTKNPTSNTYYWIIQAILSWHFDIHGLIAQNLAIDVNTLENNPYEKS